MLMGESAGRFERRVPRKRNWRFRPIVDVGPSRKRPLKPMEAVVELAGANGNKAAGAADASYRRRRWLALVVGATRSLPLELRNEGAPGRPRRRVLPKDHAH